MALLRVEDLTIDFRTLRGIVHAVKHVGFELERGEILAIVGETGSGKTTVGLSIIRLLAPNARVVSGRIWFDGRELLELPEEEMRRIRGREISIIFQEPRVSLNPVLTVGEQLMEIPREHMGVSKQEAYQMAREMLRKTGMGDPDRVMRSYPHELSGGMAQRVMIAMALMLRPKLLIADEPTSALDVTVQAQVMELMKQLVREVGSSVIFITHDLALAAEFADRVLVMYLGEVVEQASIYDVFYRPQHRYTRALIQAIPRIGFRGRLKPLEEIDW